MMIYFLLLALVTAYVGDAQINPIKTEDLKNIVDSVTKDVDNHLKMAYTSRRLEPLSLPDSPELYAIMEDTENGKEYKNFIQMIQDSMHRHLVDLGKRDAENDGSTVYKKFTPEANSKFSSGSAPELPNADKDGPEESPRISEIRIGSTKGVPGVNFPDYTDIPITSFTCEGKPHFPGFYADLDTGCQVFHVCWPDRRESFLCPMGTTFNQQFRVCDYWYNSNCSLAPYYYTIMNSDLKPDLSESESSMIFENTDSTTYGHTSSDSVMPVISQFMPIKTRIVVYPKTATKRLKIVTTATVGENKKSDFEKKPNRKNSTSKHSRLPRSLQYTKSDKDADIGNLLQLPLERTLFHFYKALDCAVADISSDETWSKLSGYAKTAVKNIKSFLSGYIKEPLEHFNPEPGSEMYKQDIEMKLQLQDEVMWKNILVVVSTLMEQYREREIQLQREALKPEPLTNLNPRFIIKPAGQQTSEHQNSEIPTTYGPQKLQHEDSLNLYPVTKTLLLKNIKLFKTKNKHV